VNTLAYPRRIEAGPWFSVGRPLTGEAVHQRLRQEADGGLARPYCVYVHVPFCKSICSFCALYTRAVAPDDDPVFDEYLDLVIRSIESHPWRGDAAPPTTVHFGGGTPLFLGMRRFGRLVDALKAQFGTSATCEWAIETTTTSMDDATVDALGAMGFQRIHLGIQTLDDPTRKRVGRHETGEKCLERIAMLEGRGFFTSVDLIVGFDGVGPAVVADDLERLYDVGVRMFSICELRERGGPRLGIKDLDVKATMNFSIWQLIWEFMAEKQLAPIHLGQFGRQQADNLYFTHPARGEDCLAIGPYSHGCSGDLYYGNALLPDYYEAIRQGRAPIKVGVEYGEDARVIRAIERELLAHRLTRPVVDAAIAAYPDEFPAILGSWFDQGLLVDGSDDGALRHSLEGSWFVGNMIHDARAMLDAPQERTA
jgi:coproporphyrinogen III oxidase-like Fe-S oxidoreductase